MSRINKGSAWYMLNGVFRYCLAHSATRFFPLYILNEYPKSGASWVGEMLSEALQIPFPRNRLPMLRSSILHGHMMHKWNMDNVLLVWRDGRDVLVSQYYHWLFENDRDNARLVKQSRADLNFDAYEDIGDNLQAFIRYVYEQNRHPRFSWNEFVDRWAGCSECVHVKYEALRDAPSAELCRIVLELTGKKMDIDQTRRIVEAHSFEQMSGRRAGNQDSSSFMRKGVVGDWKNHFGIEARRLFHNYAGDALITLGYEEDDAWVSDVG